MGNKNEQSSKETPRRLEAEFDPRNVAIVGTTFYPKWYPGEVKDVADTDKIRGDLGLAAMKAGRDIGYQIVVADAMGSSETFREELATIEGIHVLQRDNPSRGPGRRLVIEEAEQLSEVKAIIRTEWEKLDLIEHWVQNLTAPIRDGTAHIVVPKRNRELFAASYPDYMHTSEVRGNELCNRLARQVGLLPQDADDLDFFFGPTVHVNDPEVNMLFMEQYDFLGPKTVGARKYANPEEQSDAQFFPVLKALSLGLSVVGVEIPFEYPPMQKENEGSEDKRQEFEAKRKGQRLGFSTEVLHYLRLLSEDPKVKAKSKLSLVGLDSIDDI